MKDARINYWEKLGMKLNTNIFRQLQKPPREPSKPKPGQDYKECSCYTTHVNLKKSLTMSIRYPFPG